MKRNKNMRRISVGWLEIGPEERKNVLEVLDSGRITEGAKTYEFEKKWADFIGAKYCVATSSGTAALITVLTALKYLYKLENRPKIITSPLTYISVIHAIVLAGFEPVFVDIDPFTFGISPEAVERHLIKAKDKNKYSIILPVDLMGFSVQIDKIKSIAKKYNLIVLDDASEAHGSVYRGKKCGAAADAGVFSFYIAHNIQAGEMGAIVTNHYDIYRLSKKIKTNGRLCECRICTRSKGICPYLKYHDGKADDFDPRFLHDLIGYNFKTMEFQAAIALAQLGKINDIISKRQRIVKYLNEKLSKYSGILQLPDYSSCVSYLAYPLVIRKPRVICRKALRMELEKRGVETRPLFGCVPLQQPAYSHLKKIYKGKLPNAEFVGENGFYIGAHQYLKTEDLEYIVRAFEEIMERKNG
ncbi:MAG: DegT/DnrJ/EryC1/StrS family aminotransferase [Candidatus Omnitrophica bacterium]|nr:DegT/DnrJ/EryC1/StrS family aminotransferase [Candidatus Omnitrophota bacterium]HOX55239.1 DegT/DnrJ/EryC1/StrS family aminotransferase [Candidatus Omnitrophota bacterium]